MNEELEKFAFEGQEVDFIPGANNNVIVNATQMAKIFDKRIDVFLKTEPTKAFIEAIKFPPVGGNLGIKPDEDLIQTKGRKRIRTNWICLKKPKSSELQCINS